MGQVGEPKGSQTVERALNVLECVAAADAPISVAEIARRCELTRPTAHRLVITLQNRGYLASDEGTQRYRLGAYILSLGTAMLQGMRLQDVVRPNLLRINQFCDETVHLAVRQQQEVVYVDKVESSQAVRMHSIVGARGSLHSTSLGKAIWAFLPDGERETLLESVVLDARTPQTITERSVLAAHLDQIRANGYALDEVENEEGIRCIGVPILDSSGYPIAAMSISGPAFRVSSEKLREFAAPLVSESMKASSEFGYREHSSSDH